MPPCSRRAPSSIPTPSPTPSRAAPARVVDAPQPPPKRVAVGARVVWEGLKGVVEAEVAPGEFTIRFDYGGVQHEVRAEELS